MGRTIVGKALVFVFRDAIKLNGRFEKSFDV